MSTHALRLNCRNELPARRPLQAINEIHGTTVGDKD